MDEQERLKLAKAWIAHTKEFRETRGDTEHWWAAEKIWEMERNEPESLWTLILLIHSSAPEDAVIVENLAAGPLEMLLVHHGSKMIGLVEEEAERNLRFANLLGGVWKNQMTDEIWARVQAVQDRVGWDGDSKVHKGLH
jgi:hypothetical protein